MKQIILTVILAISLAACTSKPAPKEKESEVPAVLVETTLHVDGMHCNDCENSIAKGVIALAGIDSVKASYLDSSAFVRFDSNKIKLDAIKKAIEERGFEVASN